MSYLKSIPSSLSKYQKLARTAITATTKNGTKKYLIWVFWSVNLKNYCYVCNQRPQICRNTKKKKKMFKRKKKLGPKMLYMCILGCKFEKPLIYLKSASLNLLKYNVLCKNKSP